MAYAIYKELERVLYKGESSLLVKIAAELVHTMYQIIHQLSESKTIQSQLLGMDEQQMKLVKIIENQLGCYSD